MLGASLTGLLLICVLSACGTSSPPPQQDSGSGVLTESDFSKHPQGSVQRAFLEFWSDLQYRSWADAVAFYDPGFRAYVGTADVIGAKELNSSIYPVVRPEITRVQGGDREATVYYTTTLPDGTKGLDSVSWRKDGGNWQIVYDSRLDAELGQFASNQAEIEANGSLPTDASAPPSGAALRAAKAAEGAQAGFQQQELKEKP